ncbi:MAG: resolvase/recombinase [Candidatus Methanoperedens nitroreducens]|uniref:Resolvase/recombinase n=1 Tax=Candidatus Methanoperedens nitratireducens TaxID=1392998 RepID=A0A0P8A751_9EURY|nr:KaiC domain-containing protein [Candidatus Methanoperedens sp. BLZ2]KAB2948300.1 MAG: KaiC domain-containing protein [Candidatus Methanoperedens sp.]KPQ42424.1 MAG: resolvase/recombinase [Candidatus Methanoperedens sp. BLZ1]MBZ0174851.1 KaiC domain-containing protein [Candidatus Methanoperedens nitroreducens]CAG0958700.1 Circadian clock protein kinase KaiC [Methanosarcinales archaeon]MCX9077004.1 KaiC domain-containing protein [Candidatus Methanoperedens sp.]
MEPLNTGVIGFDEMLKGGIPKEHIVAVLGSPGTGKSTFALQFIYAGLLKGENCVYLSLEESEDTIVKTASIFGWDLKPYITNKKLVLIRLSTMNIKAAAAWVENDLPRLFKSFNVKRLVIDPITLYEMLYESETLRREHLFNFAEKIREHGITVIMTSETNNINPYNSKYGVIEYIADGVVLLRQVRHNDLQSVATVIEVSKMRRIEHSRDIKPYSITKNGIVVHSEAEVFS